MSCTFAKQLSLLNAVLSAIKVNNKSQLLSMIPRSPDDNRRARTLPTGTIILYKYLHDYFIIPQYSAQNVMGCRFLLWSRASFCKALLVIVILNNISSTGWRLVSRVSAVSKSNSNDITTVSIPDNKRDNAMRVPRYRLVRDKLGYWSCC